MDMVTVSFYYSSPVVTLFSSKLVLSTTLLSESSEEQFYGKKKPFKASLCLLSLQTKKLACASVVSHRRTIPQNAYANSNSPFNVSPPYDAGMYEPDVMQ